MNTDAINEIRKAAEAAIEADQAFTDSGTCDLTRLTVYAMSATRAMRDDLTPATVLELCRLAEIGQSFEEATESAKRDIEKLLGVDMRLPVDPNYNPTFDI